MSARNSRRFLCPFNDHTLNLVCDVSGGEREGVCGEGEGGAKKEDRLAGCVARVVQTVVDGPVPVQVQSQSGSSSGHIKTCPDKLEMLKLWILFHKVDLHSVDCRHSLLLAAREIT